MPPYGPNALLAGPVATPLTASASGIRPASRWRPRGFRATPDHIVVVEVVAAILLVGAAVAFASTGDLCLPGSDVHPLWIPVLVFAARYGMRGLFISVALGAVAVGAVALAEHGTLDQLASRGRNPHDMIALVAATLVAWTAMIRDRRLAQMVHEQDDMARALVTSEESASALREVAGVLRDRLDRIDMSISLWRDIAGRLDQGLLSEAAAAALELASIRSGAASGFVQVRHGNRLQTLATYGHAVGNFDISRDRTVRHVLAHGRAALREQVPCTSLEDCEVAIPIIDPDTRQVVGVLAMRDAPPGRLRPAEVRDLEVVGAWLAEAFPRPLAHVGGSAS